MQSTILFLLALSFTLAEDSNEGQFTNANNLFTLSAYKQVARIKNDNFLVSPFSVETVLAFAQSGCKGETAEEIRNALHLPNDKDKIESAIKTILPKLKSNGMYTLQTANKLYVLKNFSIKEEFKKAATEVYHAESESIDFTKNVEAARTINNWVEKHTNNKIKDLISSDNLDEYTRTILINALYFKADWSNRFRLSLTSKDKFYKTTNDTVEVDTLHHYRKWFKHYECPHLKAQFLELPFKGREASLVVVLPNEKDGLASIENQIDQVFSSRHQLESQLLNVALPKFKIETAIDFSLVLDKLGVKKAFDDKQADLSGIAGNKGDLIINKVEQKTFIDVSEEGVEAAGAIYVLLPIPPSAPIDTPKDFIADHPFIFYIKVNDLVIFIGRVTDPSKS